MTISSVNSINYPHYSVRAADNKISPLKYNYTFSVTDQVIKQNISKTHNIEVDNYNRHTDLSKKFSVLIYYNNINNNGNEETEKSRMEIMQNHNYKIMDVVVLFILIMHYNMLH